ncbi:DNA helicase protein [Dioscorea alata]|uniref:DNA helicase protein n=2 Tax=Dioscorea alata TaxID=55571 RepID=A0ACB7VWW0_DIOAL|nr:DNA helicase protein [Dioscorea alata]KAH7679103.1 DNA helicase protein [Dioscorea alata]
MREAGPLHDRMIDRNWVLKRKRKRVAYRSELSRKEDPSLPLETPRNYSSAKRKLKGDVSVTRFSNKIKGHDGYYFECVECDLGGNLLCCDSCPRTYHLECLNPPLKRTPPGKWQCPNCCGQKEFVNPSRNAEASSRKARTKGTFEKLNHVHRSSSDRVVAAGKSSVHDRRFSKKNKATICRRAPSVEKKPDASELDVSCSTKSSNSSDGVSINGNVTPSDDKAQNQTSTSCDLDSNSKKGTDSSVKLSDDAEVSPEAILNEVQAKKPIVRLDPPTERSKKNRRKCKLSKRDKKGILTEKVKLVAQIGSTNASNESSDPEPRELPQKRKSVTQSTPISKEKQKLRKLSNKKRRERSPEKVSPISDQLHERGHDADKTVKFHDDLQDSTQQVDRILGCRIQRSSKVSAYSQLDKFSGSAQTKSGINLVKLPIESGSSDINPGNGEKDSGVKICKTVECFEESEATKTIESSRDQSMTLKDSKILDDSAVNAVDNDKKAKDESLEENATGELLTSASHADCSKQESPHVPSSCDSEGVHCTSLDAQPDSSVDNGIQLKTAEDPKPIDEDTAVYEFLVKWMGQSNIHNSWVSESQLKNLAKRKLENYKAKYGTALLNICEEQWRIPQRVIALRVTEDGIDEALIKWYGLPYDECTWERLDEPVIEKSAHLIDEYKQFESQAMEKDLKDDICRAKDDFREVAALVDQPKELQGGSLFSHQLEALNWLRKCWHRSKNVILADEMGLGKTVSACAFISSLCVEFKAKLPCLVLVPLSTMPNWMAEFTSWTPHLNVVEYHGGAKARAMIRQYEWHACGPKGSHTKSASYKFNVLLTTYEMVLADSSHLRSVSWEALIVDEGHRLKNSSSKLFGLLNTFSFQHRVLLTGTPLQNNIGEMYNLLHFLQPVSFSSLSAFEEKFNDLSNAEKVEELKKLVAPHMLRRLKKDAMKNIPPKTERIVPVELSSIQAEYYRAMLTKNYQILRNIGKGGVHQSMLNIVMQLRKVCNHPYLIPGTEPESGSTDFLQEMRIKASGKLTLLHSMLKILNKEGHRVLIFSQMTKLLDILEDYLTIEYGSKTFERVDGSVSVADRQAAIARFNQDKSRFVFLLSTRSCGLGINLATADTVIIYDSDFNPHADIQAMNRAHRIGQSSRLLVYRLVVRASVEERILQLAKKKLMLDQLFVNKSESQKEVEDILRWGTEELFKESDDVTGKDPKDTSSTITDIVVDGEVKHRRRVGGLGDVYQDKCTDGPSKIVWDESAILKLLDRSNLQSGASESPEGDLENDMLGSVKSLEWNEDSNEDLVGTDSSPNIVGDGSDHTPEIKEDNVASVTEENEWDRLLRVRWEKYQTEEEATLGRGKRLRKAVSYKETFATIPSEALSESGNEDEEPEPEYTPAGRAHKEKYAKLRARQKERLARRRIIEIPFPTEGLDSHAQSQIPNFKEKESACPRKTMDDTTPSCSRINDQETSTSHPVEDKDKMVRQGKSFKHGIKRFQNTLLDLSVRPPGSLPHDVALPNLQSKNASYPSTVPPSNNLPVLGLCAPNATQAESASRKFQSFLSLPSSSSHNEHRGTSAGMPDFSIPPTSCSGPSNMNIKDAQQILPETSGEVLRSSLKHILSDSYIPFCHGPPPASKGSGHDPHDCSSSSFAAFREKMCLPSLGLDSRSPPPPPKFPLPSMNSARPSHMDLLPNLSLSTNMDHPSVPFEELPNVPLVPHFRQQLNDCLKLKQQAMELPSMLGLSQTQTTHNSLPENHKRVLDSIMMRTGSARSKFSKKRVKLEVWSEDELDALWIGVRRHGRGNWDSMLKDLKLKFSKHRTPGDLSSRWSEEQLKIFDGPTFNSSRSSRPPLLPGISDGMMTRALFGSKFASLGADPSKFRSHLTDIQLGRGDLNSSFLPIDPGNHFGTVNESFPSAPSWLPEKSNFSADFGIGSSDRPGNLNLHADHPFDLHPFAAGKNFVSPNMNYSASGDIPKMDDQASTSKYLKLPNFLDRSLHPMAENHNTYHFGESSSGFPLDAQKKQNLGKSPINIDAAPASSSKADKLPHWLRDAVSLPPSKPPEPELPPTVTAIAQSVRLLYGEDKPTIPPFIIPGPPLFQPKDPRKDLKKKRKLQKLRQVPPEVAGSSKNSQPDISDIPSAGPNPRLPSLNLNLTSPSSPSVSPSVITPEASFPVTETFASKEQETTTEPTSKEVPGDLKPFNGVRIGSTNSLMGLCAETAEAGDCSKTKTDTFGDEEKKTDELSSEETVHGDGS